MSENEKNAVAELPGLCVICERSRTTKRYCGAYVCDGCFMNARTNPDPDVTREFTAKLLEKVSPAPKVQPPPPLDPEIQKIAMRFQVAGARYSSLVALAASYASRPSTSPLDAATLALATLHEVEKIAAGFGFTYEGWIMTSKGPFF
jgi:hypothetical protein